MSVSAGTGFRTPTVWIQHGGPFIYNYALAAVYRDVNNDRRADLIYTGTDGRKWLSTSTGTKFNNAVPY